MQERAIFFLQCLNVLELPPVFNVITLAEISKVNVSAISSLHQSPIRIKVIERQGVYMNTSLPYVHQDPFRPKRTRKSSVPDRAQWFSDKSHGF